MRSKTTQTAPPRQDEADAAAGTVTKRQRRKLENSQHAWPQFPRISSSAARQKAYMRASGLVGGDMDESNATDNNNSDISAHLGRRLGSADARTRHTTVRQLQAYLKARSAPAAPGLSEWDLLKLTKCLWYTLFLADRVAVQDELATQIANCMWSVGGTPQEDEYAATAYLEACEQEHGENVDENDEESVTLEELENTFDADEEDGAPIESSDSSSEADVEAKQLAMLQEADSDDKHGPDDDDHNKDLAMNMGHCRGAHLASLWVRTLWRTLVREWPNLDKYRVDKCYTLLRYTIRQVYSYMAQRHWHRGICQLFNDALFEEVLSQRPNGVRYHIVDLCLEELALVNSTAPLELTEATFLDVLEPFFALGQTGSADGDDTIHERVLERVLEPFLDVYSVYATEQDRSPNDNADTFRQVHVGTVSQFIFEVASDPGTRDGYRQNFYRVHKQYVKKMNRMGPSFEVDIDSSDEEDNAIDQLADESGSTVEEEHALSPTDVNDCEFDDQLVEAKKKTSIKKATSVKSSALSGETLSIDKKKKSKKRRTSSNQGLARLAVEEEVTITSGDQKAAKKAMKERQASSDSNKKHKADKEQDLSPNSTRVKFARKNKARSWQASMKGLRTMDTPTPNGTPDSSILRNKGANIVIKKRAAKGLRKRAADYF